jgi:hypothetical protein
MLEKVKFGSEAFEYIRSQLSEGNSLSFFVASLPLEDGQVIAYLPSDIDIETATQFNIGGIASRDETEAKLAEFISGYLSESSKNCAIFEHALARPNDPSLLRSKSRILIYKTEVYYLLSSKDNDLGIIIDTIRTVTSHVFICVLTEADNVSAIQSSGKLTSEILQRFALNAQHVLISAYDDEADLIWSKVR